MTASVPTTKLAVRAAAKQWLWPAALLAGLILLAYWPGRHGGFVFDDIKNIVENPWLHVSTLDWRDWLLAIFSSPASDIQRPLSMLSFAVNHYFTGLAPMPMKLTNVAIHALNAVLVLSLARQLLAMAPLQGISAPRRDWAAVFIAAAWALHPINLMAVLYVVQRMESLSHLFVFAGLWLYLLGRQRQLAGGNGWALMVGGLVGGTVLGALAKESAVLLPLYAFLAELCLFGFRGRDGTRDRRGLVVLFALVLVVPAVLGMAWLLPRVLSAGAWASRNFDIGERLLTEARVVLDYLRWTLLPDLGRLSLYHDDYSVSRGWLQPPSTLLSVVALGGLLGAAAWLRRRRPLMALGILWFLGAQLLTATILPLELVFEHRNYFAALGVCLLLADLLLLWPRGESSRRIGALLAIVFVIAMAGLTHLRAREWNNPVQFNRSEVAKHPQSPRATYDWARTLVNLTRLDPASPVLPDAWQALEQARAAPGSGVLPHQGALILAARTGSLDQRRDWWHDMQRRLREQPRNSGNLGALVSLVDCASLGHCRFPAGDMMATFEAALHQGPHPRVLAAYGKYALNVMGDPGLALRLWQDASARDPDDVAFRYNLALLLIDLGREDEARGEIAAIRRLGALGQNEALADELDRRLHDGRVGTPPRTRAR